MSAAPVVRVCKTCVNYRLKPGVELFDGDDLQTPGTLAAQNKWDEERRQRAKEEMQRMQARHAFEYEPNHYAWCAAFTIGEELVAKAQAGDEAALQQVMTAGGATMDPVSGELKRLYILCQWKNPDGRCEQYEQAR